MLDNYVSVKCSRLSQETEVKVGLFKSEKFSIGIAENAEMKFTSLGTFIDLYRIIWKDQYGDFLKIN